jgi:Na+/H+ antiporter NhaC
MRFTMLLEWSIVLMIPYIILVLVLKRRTASRTLKRLTWLALACVLILSNFAVMYGMVVGLEGSQNISNSEFDMSRLVPVDNVLYVILMGLSTASALALGVWISKHSFLKSEPEN